MAALNKITYTNKTNPVAITDRTKQATAEDFNEIKTIVNALADRANIVGTPGFKYIAHASSSTGAGFTLDPTSKLPYEAILTSDTEITGLNADSFAGLWRLQMVEAPVDGSFYVRKNGEWVLLPGIAQLVYPLTLPSGNVDERCSGAVESTDYPTGWVLEPDVSPLDLSVTHNMGRKVTGVTVMYVDNGMDHLAKDNVGYSSFFCDDNRVVIENLTPTLGGYPIVIHLIFA